jgi:hypothetical protein
MARAAVAIELSDDEERELRALLRRPCHRDGSTHWSVRRLAAATGISRTTVHRIWRDHKLKPHQVRSLKFSKDPQLTEKIVDVVGLYMDPPKAALVLCVDEKTQIQALDRTQPTLPMKPGKAARMTHDYKRNGTTSLYAALRIATGEITGACYPLTRSTAIKSSWRSSTRSFAHTRVGRCTSCSTTPRRTQRPRSSAGWSAAADRGPAQVGRPPASLPRTASAVIAPAMSSGSVIHERLGRQRDPAVKDVSAGLAQRLVGA